MTLVISKHTNRMSVFLAINGNSYKSKIIATASYTYVHINSRQYLLPLLILFIWLNAVTNDSYFS